MKVKVLFAAILGLIKLWNISYAKPFMLLNWYYQVNFASKN